MHTQNRGDRTNDSVPGADEVESGHRAHITRATEEHALTVLDLFAGAGGLSYGFHEGDPRYKVTGAVEQDIAAAATYAQNFDDVVYAGDISKWLAEEELPEVDVVIGGPPCQGFSQLGKRDPHDERNALWRHYVEAVRRARPRAFVMENVPGFLDSREFRTMSELSKFADYDIRAEVLDASGFGTPQVRKRAVVIGVHRDLDHPGHPRPSSDVVRTVADALQGLRKFTGDFEPRPGKVRFRGTWLPGAFKGLDLHFTQDWSDLSLARFRAIGYGGGRHDLPDELSMECWRNNPRSASDVMGRLVWEKPSVTIRTEFFKPEKGRFLHPTQHRAITHLEAARLQGFPDSYRWVGTRTQIARQIGNAVPVPLGRAIGQHLAQALI